MKLFLSKNSFSFKLTRLYKNKLYLLVTDVALWERCLSLLISSCLPPKSSLHRFLSPPFGRSVEYVLPVMMHLMVAFPNINNNKIHDNCLGKRPIVTLTFKTATAYNLTANERFANCSPYALVEVIATNTTFFSNCNTITHVHKYWIFKFPWYVF